MQTFSYLALAFAAVASAQAAAFPDTLSAVATTGAGQNQNTNSPDCTGDYGYATFYEDTACSENPTQAFSMGNDGCIANQPNKHSIYIQAGCLGTANLVFSPGTECNCQDECKETPNTTVNSCWDLTGNAGAQSFRFITQGCGSNNC